LDTVLSAQEEADAGGSERAEGRATGNYGKLPVLETVRLR
jgi:hypothetical protein